MPSINRIRVNNVKYNFGTQQYDDFTMRMYGKNTLYDLVHLPVRPLPVWQQVR